MHALLRACGGFIAACCIALPARAGVITGGSALLDQAAQVQLQTWLGQGDMNLANIYTLHAGDTAHTFHVAADGKGATFAVMRVSLGGIAWLVGGYDPQSWESTEVWHETPLDKDRNAFVFNLTNREVFHQVPTSYILPSQGQKQTWNSAALGPAFGEGGDLWVTGDMQNAYSWLFTYGDPARQGTSLIDGSVSDPQPVQMHLDALEIFTISPAPEPAQAWLLLSGLGALLLWRRWRTA